MYGHLMSSVKTADATVKAQAGYLAAFTIVSDGTNVGSVKFSDDTTEIWNAEVPSTAGTTATVQFPAPGLYFGTSLKIDVTDIKKVSIAYY